MKTKPIIFNNLMVEAILAGRKSQTRRIIKEVPGKCMFCGCTDKNCKQCVQRTGTPCSWVNDEHTICSACPSTESSSYKEGDILWVRETFTEGSDSLPFVYKAGYPDYIPTHIENIPEIENMKWKPSIFMPKEACRIFLQVTDVKAERFRDITQEDAIAEGVDPLIGGYLNYLTFKPIQSPILSFKTLWITINGPHSYDYNPWVWVYTFKQVEKPENF